MKNANLILLFLFLVATSATAQQFTLSTVSSYNRLPVSGVNCLLEDEEGYMWYGTNEAGLCRDDGYQIMSFGYNAAPDIMHNSDVLCMASAPDHRIWFGTREGLYVLDKKTYQISKVDESVEHMRISSIAVTSDGSVWAVCSSHIMHLAADGSLIRNYDSMMDGFPRTTNDIYVDSNNTVWVAQWKGELLRKLADENEFQPIPDFDDLDAFCVEQDTVSGCYYVGTWGHGIYRIGSDMQTVTSTGIDEGYIKSILVDSRRSLLWTTTYDKGVHCYRMTKSGLTEVHSRFDFILHLPMVVGGLISDRFHNPWIPGYSVPTFVIAHSNNQIDSRKITAEDNSFALPVITDVIDNHDFAWLKRESGGVFYYDTHIDNSRKIEFCSDTAVIIPAPNGNMFLFNKDRSIWRIDRADQTFTPVSIGRVGFNVSSMLYTNSDSILYIGGRNGRLAISRSGTAPVTVCDSLGWVFKICDAVSQQYIYALTYTRGVLRIDKNTWSVEELVPNNYKFSDIAVSPSGSLWVSSNTGRVYRIDSGNLVECTQLATANGDAILRILFDELGHLWLMSKSFVREADVETGVFRTIYANDNQLGMQTFENISISDGGVTVAGAGGIARLRSSSNLNEPSRDVRVAISEYSYGGRRFITTYNQQSISIPSDSADYVTLSLTNFDYLKAANNEFRFRIEGLSDAWTTLRRGDNEIQMHKLPKGTYSVYVTSTDGFGNWGRPVLLMTLHRQPAWWESNIAYTLYVFIFLLILFALWYLNRIMHEKRLRFENLMALYDELKLSVNDLNSNSDESMSDSDKTTQPADEIKENPSDDVSESNEKTADGQSDSIQNAISSNFFADENITKALGLLEKNLSNESYSVDQFASDMCMSRMTLYRRIYSVVGQTPSELIRTYRLDKAAKLLQSTNISIVEISERVGFSSPRYFSTCFRNKYGVMPKEFRKQ